MQKLTLIDSKTKQKQPLSAEDLKVLKDNHTGIFENPKGWILTPRVGRDPAGPSVLFY